MENLAKETYNMSQKRFQEMSRAYDLQEKVVDMEILRKDLTTCVDEYKRAYSTKAKQNILNQLEEAENRQSSSAEANQDEAPEGSFDAGQSLKPNDSQLDSQEAPLSDLENEEKGHVSALETVSLSKRLQFQISQFIEMSFFSEKSFLSLQAMFIN